LQQDTAATLPSNHSHISKVLEWGFDENHDFKASLYGCVLCDEISPVPFTGADDIFTDHTDCGDDCFGCKIRTLELSPGDAAGRIIESGTTQKKWDKELDFYRQARKDGIQPEGTSTAAIEKAYKASEVLEKAYNGNSMPKSEAINKKTVEVMKEIGAV
jgi:di/tripeptidase